MNADQILHKLAALALPVHPQAALQQPSDECLTDDEMTALVARENVASSTLDKLTGHAMECDRCWALVSLVIGEQPLGDLEAARAQVDRAIDKHLTRMPQPEKAALGETLIKLVMQWMPEPASAQPAIASAYRDTSTARPAAINITDQDLPVTLRFALPDGPGAQVTVILLDQQGEEAFRGETDDQGEVHFWGPAGSYTCRVEGYDGPLLQETS